MLLKEGWLLMLPLALCTPLTLRHTLAVKNLFNADVVEPEYIRGRINTLPAGYEQAVRYMLQVSI